MNRLILFVAVLFFLSVTLISSAGAHTLIQQDCVEPFEDNSFLYEWQDSFADGSPSETRYRLEAPCKVNLGDTFYVVAKVHDPYWIYHWYLAYNWSIEDTYYELSDTTYSNPIQTVVLMSGSVLYVERDIYWNWKRRARVVYSGSTAYNHIFEFKFRDLGHGAGGHWGSEWVDGSIIGGTTLDPIKTEDNTPPVADAGADTNFASEDQNLTVINGLATDADGEALSYRWLEGGTLLYGPAAVNVAGGAPLDLSFISPLSIGTHTLSLEVTDGIDTATDTVVVNVSNTPPVADAGPDFILPSEEQNLFIINGKATDSGGDQLTYRWLEGGVVLLASTLVDSNGNAPLDLSFLPPLQLGTHTFTLEVSDATNTVTDSVVVNVANTPPTAVAAGGGTYQIAIDIALNGTVSDFDGDLLDYEWYADGVLIDSGSVSTPGGGAPAALPSSVITGGLPLGTHLLDLVVTDGVDQTTASIILTVIDTVAPTVAPASSTALLWPVTGDMVPVTVATNAADNSGAPVTIGATVVSNEPQEGGASVDYEIVSVDQQTGVIDLLLRSERNGNGNGRVYTVAVTATDGSGNSSTAAVEVKVPHDRRGDNNGKANK
ncbi:MAG: hypothetical protein V3T30_06940 [Thermodesulfobacteriota bacterium]